MITLGINAAFHDSAAVLVVDGVVVAAAEEERFTRIKHAKRPVPFSAWELPFHAIHFCLERAGIVLADCDHIGYSFDPMAFVADPALLDRGSVELPLLPADVEAIGPWESPWDPLFLAEIVNAPGQLADGAPHHLRRRFERRAGGRKPSWHFVDHHTCHQASACLAAPFDRCAVLTLDGRGERATTTYGRYRDDRYETFGEVLVPHSLGLLYERITTHLGFLHSSDEYKVMALAALGDARRAAPLLEAIRVLEGGRFEVAPLDLAALFGPARGADEALGPRHFDIAAALQAVLERTGLALAGWLGRATGEPALAMAGGVALNCVMNSVIRDSGLFPAGVWVQPAAGDSGTALGAALWVDSRERRGPSFGVSGPVPMSAPEPTPLPTPLPTREPTREPTATDRRGAGDACNASNASNEADPAAGADAGMPHRLYTLAPRRWEMRDALLGPEYDDTQIERQLAWAKLDFRRLDSTAEIAAATADLLARDCMVGWFQGRMEYGPRALGARSILASPVDPSMQARLNELKDREDFRPVAPVVPVESLGDWFGPAAANGGRSPFMLFVYDVAPGQSARIPSACHTDRTARVQTVDAATQPRFHALLRAFEQRTGVPVLVNTSFNVRGQPIVCTPRDAIEAFFSTPLDALVIGSFLLVKPGGRAMEAA